LGDRVVLAPNETIDFLELVRENDADESGECPQLRIEATLSDVPTSDIAYEVDVTVDAYASLGG
jgi:hypothetical protein